MAERPRGWPRETTSWPSVEWIADEMAPDDRIVLWAHNTHVSTGGRWMGGLLRDRFGDGYLSVALTFAAGSFHSRATLDAPVAVHSPPIPGPENYELELRAADLERYVLDLRELPDGGSDTAALTAVRRLRMVGTLFQGQAGILQPLTDYDALVFVRTSTPSMLLPFVCPPGGFAG